MEDLLIPGWAVYLIAGLVMWMTWLTWQTFINRQAIAINTSNDENVGEELKEIKNSIQKGLDDNKESFKELNRRIDVFIGNEVTFLKSKL